MWIKGGEGGGHKSWPAKVVTFLSTLVCLMAGFKQDKLKTS